jgi:hypothetical protein
MAITTLDGALAGMQPPAYYAKALSGTLVAGRPMNINYLAGIPGAMAAPSPGAAGAALTSYAGQIPIPAASNNTHLARFSGVSSAQGGILMLCDRLWHNSGLSVTTTTSQTVNSVTWPARDSNGSTNGVGVYVGLEISAATGAGAATPTISYTDESGNSGATGSMQVAYAASSITGTFYPFTLAAGDTGVRSVQSCTLGVSMTSGSISLVAYRPIATIELTVAGLPNAVDVLTSGMPRLYDTSVPFILYIPQTTTTTLTTGTVVYTQG